MVAVSTSLRTSRVTGRDFSQCTPSVRTNTRRRRVTAGDFSQCTPSVRANTRRRRVTVGDFSQRTPSVRTNTRRRRVTGGRPPGDEISAVRQPSNSMTETYQIDALRSIFCARTYNCPRPPPEDQISAIQMIAVSTSLRTSGRR